MYNYEYPKNLSVGRVTLELSLKPFKKLDDEYIESVCRELFDEWKPLLRHATGASVMLWTSDGSEILDYSGNVSDEFEWARYIGIGNPKKVIRIPGTSWEDVNWIHVRPVLYTDEPPVMHYSDLKRIISAFKKVGKEITGFDITVGETFDPGPEFAYSEFKFERHTEINKGTTGGGWIHCAGRLHGDTRKYAAYPNGIPEGTVFGEFLSRQFAALKRDVGFDFLWLSNGFGFSLESWNWTGEIFDGQKFDAENADEVRASIREFWENYTPNTDFVTMVRGSNLSTAMDIAAHGCPIDVIYKNNIVGPPNSPWAALDSRFGLELVGYLSHIACVPENGYDFRYYTHDPWWLNSPWFDRYGRSPHDIYLPLAVTRMNENGKTDMPRAINFLSADDSFGNIPRKCPNEVIPHILEGYRTYPDAPGLVTWLYPFDYYCRLGLYEGKNDRMIMDDWLIESAIDVGFPINTVVSDRVFASCSLEPYKNTVIVCPVPEADSDFEKCVFRAIDGGLSVLLYGSTEFASEKLRKLIGIELASGISGKLTVNSKISGDTYEKDSVSDILIHDPVVSAGGIHEISDGKTEVLCEVSSEAEKRTYATFNASSKLAWLRASFPHKNRGRETTLPELYDRKENFVPSVLLRNLLSVFGTKITFHAFSTNDKLPLILMSGYKNGYCFTEYSKDETIRTSITTPFGAPAITNTAFILENDTAEYSLPKWLREDCRVFIRQKARTKVSVRTETPGSAIVNDRRIVITGLENAVITFMPETDTIPTFYVETSALKFRVWGDSTLRTTQSDDGRIYVSEPVSGKVDIVWQSTDTRKYNIDTGRYIDIKY